MFIKVKVLKRVISVLCAAAMATSCTTGFVSAVTVSKKKDNRVISKRLTTQERIKKLQKLEEDRIENLKKELENKKVKLDKWKLEKEKKEKKERLERKTKLEKEKKERLERKTKLEKSKKEKQREKKITKVNIGKNRLESKKKKVVVGERKTKEQNKNLLETKDKVIKAKIDKKQKVLVKTLKKGIEDKLKKLEIEKNFGILNPELNEILDLNNKETIGMSKKEKLDKEIHMALRENIIDKDGEAIANCGDEMLISSETMVEKLEKEEKLEIFEKRLEERKNLIKEKLGILVTKLEKLEILKKLEILGKHKQRVEGVLETLERKTTGRKTQELLQKKKEEILELFEKEKQKILEEEENKRKEKLEILKKRLKGQQQEAKERFEMLTKRLEEQREKLLAQKK